MTEDRNSFCPECQRTVYLRDGIWCDRCGINVRHPIYTRKSVVPADVTHCPNCHTSAKSLRDGKRCYNCGANVTHPIYYGDSQ